MPEGQTRDRIAGKKDLQNNFFVCFMANFIYHCANIVRVLLLKLLQTISLTIFYRNLEYSV